jgi:hypothetical protein
MIFKYHNQRRLTATPEHSSLMAVALQLSSLTPDVKTLIRKICVAKPNKSQFNEDPIPVKCFSVDQEEDMVYVPLGAWRSFLEEFPDREFPKMRAVCTKELYTLETDPKHIRDQDVIFEEGIEKLKRDHTLFLALHTGCGKTSMGNYFACHLKLKTAVLCHIDEVCKQWVEEFEQHSTAKVQRVTGQSGVDPDADIYIIGVQTAKSLPREDLLGIGFLIFDEAHIASITAFSKSMHRFMPRYVLGLSATPNRRDGMHKLLTMYFGPSKNYIVRKEVKEFTVYKVQTPYKPEVKYNTYGNRPTIDWTLVISSISAIEQRQDDAVDIVFQHPGVRALITSQRTAECISVYEKLIERGHQSVRLKVGTEKKKTKKNGEPVVYDYEVLVASDKKVAVGFNDPTLKMLINLSDKMDVVQLEGRLRTNGCIIYDFVDDFSTFENHWKKREAWYLERGAEIVVINRRGTPAAAAAASSVRRLPKNE